VVSVLGALLGGVDAHFPAIKSKRRGVVERVQRAFQDGDVAPGVHVVPAENFGRAFAEWRDGHPDCQDKRGPFKGRKCADRVSREYRLMQADMYNLYPAIGAVNAMRSNYNFALLPGAPNTFGACGMKIEGNRVEPPEHARGAIARTVKYMAWAYPRFHLSRQQEQLMDAWDRMHPVDQWECTRAKRIEALQGNGNPVVKGQCQQAGLWH
jgi:deoxyribonuclease-1